VVAYSLGRSEGDGLKKLQGVVAEAKANGYRVIGLSASGDELKNKINEAYKLDIEWFFSDETALKTIIRSNPGLVKLHKGTIIQKLHWNDSGELKL
jgi:peroxiredoxin